MSAPGLLLRSYRALSPTLVRAVEVFGPLSAKLRRGLHERLGLMPRLLEAAPDLQDCIWFHTSSVGEYEQSRPMIRLLREAGIGPICITHFSTSGTTYAQADPEGDFHDYLPLDHPRDMTTLIRAWHPRALIFIKYDCWPNLVMAAHKNDVPIYLFSAALPAGSRRLSRPAKYFFRALFNLFTHIGVGNAADRDRFLDRLGTTTPISLTGDTRAEQVCKRFDSSANNTLARQLLAWGGRRLVLGSTWPADEAIWLPILPGLLRDFPDLKIVLVPHEPNPGRISELEYKLVEARIPTLRLGDWDSTGASHGAAACLLVDRVGKLAEIYHGGDLAYVGGSFTTGVHSTLEPAIGHMPVLFGPRIANAEEALLMVDRGAGRIIHNQAEALDAASDFLRDERARNRAADLARDIVLTQCGAARRSVQTLLSQIA